MRYRFDSPPYFAAVLMTISGITICFLIQPEPPSNRLHLSPTSAGESVDCRSLFSMPVIAEASGRIRTTHLHEGSFVRQGDVLVQLETSQYLMRIASLKERIHFRELNRNTSGSLYEELQQTRMNLNRLTIASPHDGWITSSARLHAGELISAGTAVAVLQIQ